MRVIRAVVLVVLMLVPALTLVHRDDTGRWDLQRSAMAAPDEFSYLLMAQHFLDGGGLSLKAALGRDTFYPPGYPLLLAAWAKLLWGGRLSALGAHVLNAALLSADILLVFLVLRRLVSEPLALLITAIFATNWHVLETSLLVMSEPAFMLVTFAWLLISLRRPRWHESVPWAGAMALLATAAWAIRGAGIVCVAVTVLFPAFCWVADLRRTPRAAGTRAMLRRRAIPMLLLVLVPLLYQAAIFHFSREKSLAAGDDAGNGYVQQLLHGLDLSLPRQMLDHLGDYAASFVPWPRETPGSYFRIAAGMLVAGLALLGYLARVVPRVLPSRHMRPRALAEGAADSAEAGIAYAKPGTPFSRGPAAPWVLRAPRARRMLELYIFLYAGLYLVWPFDFARFWSPILPLMLVYAADLAIRLARGRGHLPRHAGAYVLLGLLLLLSAEEVTLELGTYARRLNYVSDALADAARAIMRESPDPRNTVIDVMGADEHFALGWYLCEESQRAGRGAALAGGYVIRESAAHDPRRGGHREHMDDMLIQTLDELRDTPQKTVLFFSYFPEVTSDTRDTLENLAKRRGDEMIFRKISEKWAVAVVWEFRNRGAAGEMRPMPSAPASSP